MAKVSLRTYNREIEGLIEQAHLDEAIAHCRHILTTFPKHLETYRLLGKAYLEAKRYDEAVDIFSRVLMAAPDDFVSHVGMSIISDEQSKMDDAIWHMERAFESQPSNAAIQGELQRLYGSRDGVEPPRIRMTRGALAHMYVQGELHPQAISELRAVLNQDPQRADMQVLLARAFFRSGQKADASDMCAQLLKRYPYCFDANRFMVELLHGSEKTESTQVYRQRVNQLDPYAAFAKESVFRSEEVAEALINLERLEYGGQEVDTGKGWGASLGIGPATPAAAAEQPEWLKAGLAETQPETATPGAPLEHEPAEAEQAQVLQDESDIPDFLRQAGWTEPSSTAGENAASIESAPLGSRLDDALTGSARRLSAAEQDELAPADLPDWLKEKMPTDKDMPAAPVQSAPEAFPEGEPVSESPEWLSSLQAAEVEQPAAPEEGKSAWLRDLEASKPSEPQPEEIPDWLKGLGRPETQAGEIESLVQEEAAPQEPISQPVKPIVLGKLDRQPDLPEKAEPPKTEISEPTLDTPGSSAKEQEEALAWLETLAAKHGAKPEELATDAARRTEKPPEWAEQARWIAESQPQAPKPPESDEIVPEDETGVWLRGLVDKESPGEPLGSRLNEAAEGETASEPTEEEEPLLSEQDAQDWLSSLQSRTAEAETASEASKVSDWLKSRQAKARATGSFTPEPFDSTEGKTASKTSLPERSEMPTWLRAQSQETPATEVPKAAEPPGKPAVPEQSEAPDWLSGLQAEGMTGVEAESGEEPGELALPRFSLEKQERETPISGEINATELPEWLRGLDKEEAAEPRFAASEDLPSWLQRESEATPEAEPTAPSDWRLVEPKSEQAAAAAEALKPSVPAAASPAEGMAPADIPALTHAQKEMNRGDIPAALAQYNKLIRRGRFLEETIRDLREALYRYPVEVSIWQTLGDAYMRANRLQEALDAFNKAEELLR